MKRNIEPEQLPIDSIKPDPAQPRKIFDEAHIKGLAKSLRTEGMINPVEIDSQGMIITGECRWRAAKLENWKRLPIIRNVKPLAAYERLRRQMAENLHQSAAGGSSPMNAIDVAKGYKRMIEIRTGKDYEPGSLSREEVYGLINGVAEELGVSKHTVYEYLNLLSEPKYVIEDVLKGRPRTLYREAASTPESFQEPVKQAIARGEIVRREDVRRLSRLAKVSPEKAEIELLRLTKQQSEAANRILNRAIELGLAIKVADFEKFSLEDRQMVHSQLQSLYGVLRNVLGELKNGG